MLDGRTWPLQSRNAACRIRGIDTSTQLINVLQRVGLHLACFVADLTQRP